MEGRFRRLRLSETIAHHTPARAPPGNLTAGVGGASILGGRKFGAGFVEEIEDEGDLVDRSGLAGAGSFEYDEAFAVGSQVIVTNGAAEKPRLWPPGQLSAHLLPPLWPAATRRRTSSSQFRTTVGSNEAVCLPPENWNITKCWPSAVTS